MSEKTAIQWTDHTFNVAWGCTKISPGCANCYAEGDAKRYGFDVWGPDKPRRIFGEKHWREPLKWNRDAEKAGVRRRVFTSSMTDVFEDHPTINREREKLWPLIASTPWLDWQILTKRAERMRRHDFAHMPNVWIGVSVENQATADERIPLLISTRARVRFVSYEPALGPIDFTKTCFIQTDLGLSSYNLAGLGCTRGPDYGPPDWIIVGGESRGSRPFDLAWARSTIATCKSAGIACFVKQLGATAYAQPVYHEGRIVGGVTRELDDRKGGDPSEWPEDLRVREFPQ